jgi:LysR family transcriptional regulator, nitrogen assimilation regulatory protein
LAEALAPATVSQNHQLRHPTTNGRMAFSHGSFETGRRRSRRNGSLWDSAHQVAHGFAEQALWQHGVPVRPGNAALRAEAYLCNKATKIQYQMVNCMTSHASRSADLIHLRNWMSSPSSHEILAMLPILDSRWSLFAKVAELGSLTLAAHALNTPSSVISRQISQLEMQCGGKLFRRTGRGVLLTEFGEVVYLRIRPLIAQTDQLADDILTASSVPIGEVHIGLLPSVAPRIATKLFQTALAQFPKVRLHLAEGSSTQLEEWLSTGRLDMALLLRERPLEDIDEPLLASISLDLIGPVDDPLIGAGEVAFAALDNLPLILPAEPHVLRRRLGELARERGISLKVVVEADTVQLQRELSTSGIGYAIVSSMAEMRAGLKLGAARIVQPEMVRHVVLGTTQHRPNTLAARSIGDLIKLLFAEIAPAPPVS